MENAAPQPEPSAAAKARLAARLGETAWPVLLTLSRFEPSKGIDQVIRAMPAVLRRFPDACYVVAGEGADQQRLEQLAKECGVAQAVRFVGPVVGDQKAAVYDAATLFVMPSRRVGNSVEGFGLTYIEAAWYCVPSIAGNNGGAVDAVLDGVTGLVCDGADAPAAEQEILRLIEDDGLRARLGSAAQQRAREVLQWSNVLAQYRALMQR